MVASHSTVHEVRAVVLKHMSERAARALVADLRQVQGNKSFRDTIELLEKALNNT